MQGTQEPQTELAARALPAPLYRALRHIFAQRIKNCALVGGTALAGYYAGHRRSDDLDLFAQDATAHRAAALAAKSLVSIGATCLETTSDTRQYARTVWELNRHRFTVDIVLDANLFQVGRMVKLKDGVIVADLETLLKTKASTLVSRASEKDLYDLIWLFGAFPDLDFEKLIDLGRQIDSGLTGESILISISGTTLSEEACEFAIGKKGIHPRSGREIYNQVLKFRRELVRGVAAYLRKEPLPPLGELVRSLEKSRKAAR